MATEKTPTYKRIKRAEAGRDDWKVKALERREEIEKLRIQLTTKENHLVNSKHLQKELKNELDSAKKRIQLLEEEVLYLKKTI